METIIPNPGFYGDSGLETIIGLKNRKMKILEFSIYLGISIMVIKSMMSKLFTLLGWVISHYLNICTKISFIYSIPSLSPAERFVRLGFEFENASPGGYRI